ncbi:trehalose-6-phosphate synthase [Streptomyces sp. NBC_01795]|uniref:alpha,alpha-trehalose-phosphate synthase (UDP-forming) n=1 Tax=unclassified Streptomyces TaxID=2593676 RepID=UPI002DDB747E|nr:MULTISPECIES: trehalose-6-phosphate synthase [unclassified Streptomyces]WSA93951.1 trehalose-6-phosphate synthase [Streptomyces sp. NBC_01795]WSB78377.1 trehalose-6-phosphate synthase [Streptomyces sp. NBC_01775]WSS13420.1 trehalose-6-phosphate synthase [Streptomyces sp. NBC_01186]
MVADTTSQVLVASNRGPVSFSADEDGTLTAKRGGGGLVSGLSAIGPETDAVWVCAALGDGDREAVRRFAGRLDPSDTGGQTVRMLDIPAATFEAAYQGVANSVLWFTHHMLYQTPLEPAFDEDFARQWTAYEEYNAAFADALAEEAAQGATVLVQDYHLTLVPGLLRERRPDLRIGHFSHTPWAPADYYRLLPDEVAARVLRGMLGADRAAFLTRRWARLFTECCERVLGATVTDDGITYEGRTTRIGVHPLGADADFLRERAYREDVTARMAQLREQIGTAPDGSPRRTVVRVDRTELSKNIVRGLYAYRRLLLDHPEWREHVVHLAFAYPSRQDLAVYRDYTAEVSRVADGVNAEFGTPGWTPVVLHVKDDFARSLAAYRLADVALVNPIRDGMNLVAKEIPVVSEEGCALVLSREAGAYEEMGEDALCVNPFDITSTAAALRTALTMDPADRQERTKRLSATATAHPPTRWLLDQLTELRPAG